MSALSALTVCLARRAQAEKPLSLEGAIFTPDHLREALAELDSPTLQFLAYCENRRNRAATVQAREFWGRLAGSVRKAATL